MTTPRKPKQTVEQRARELFRYVYGSDRGFAATGDGWNWLRLARRDLRREAEMRRLRAMNKAKNELLEGLS